MYYILLSFLLIISSNIKASSDQDIAIKNFTLMSQSPQSRTTKLDIKIAKNLTYLLKLSKKNIINKRLFKNLYQDMNKSDSFKQYSYWPKSVLNIKKQTTLKSLSSICYNKSSFQHSHVDKYFQNSLEKLCFKKLLNIIEKNKSLSTNYHRQIKNYYSKALPKVLSLGLRNELANFISATKKNKKVYSHYSKLTQNYLIKTNSTPHPDLIKTLKLNKEFTRYIQSKEIMPNTTSGVFYRQLTSMTKSLREDIDENPTYYNKKNLDTEVQKVIDFYLSSEAYTKPASAHQAMLAFAKSLHRRDKAQMARKVYKVLIEKRAHLDFQATLYEYMWSHISNSDFEKALDIYHTYGNDLNKIMPNSKLSFWTGYSFLKDGNKKKAHHIFSETIKQNPLSYYSILSAKLLAEDDNKSPEDIYLAILKRTPNETFSPKKFNHQWLRRITAFSKADNRYLINLEFKSLLNSQKDANLEVHILAAASRLKHEKNYLESFKFIYRTIDQGKLSVNEDTLQILFPSPYYGQIKRNSKTFDPVIALSLIRQESGFNKWARSHVGARGLMQLMPSTARRIKRVKTKQLYNPTTNIKIGTKFFNKLLKRYDNNLVYSLAAYNAGMRRIDDWQERNYVNKEKSMLNNIENIPFLETRKYVKLIFRNMFFYKLLNDNDRLDDSEDFNKIFDIHVGFKH